MKIDCFEDTTYTLFSTYPSEENMSKVIKTWNEALIRLVKEKISKYNITCYSDQDIYIISKETNRAIIYDQDILALVIDSYESIINNIEKISCDLLKYNKIFKITEKQLNEISFLKKIVGSI